MFVEVLQAVLSPDGHTSLGTGKTQEGAVLGALLHPQPPAVSAPLSPKGRFAAIVWTPTSKCRVFDRHLASCLPERYFTWFDGVSWKVKCATRLGVAML